MPQENNLRFTLSNFINVANDFLSSKYILANSKISALLRTITLSEDMCAYIQLCLQDFNYKQAQKDYYIALFYGDDTRKQVVLPKENKDLIAFVFLTLVDLDNGNIKLPDYLQKYFYEDGSFYESYNSFLANFVSPFCDAFIQEIQNVLDGINDNPKNRLLDIKSQKVNTQVVLNNVCNNKEVVTTLINYLVTDKTNILNTSDIADKLKGEIVIILDAFINALNNDNPREIKYAYISYKFTALANRKCNFNLHKVTRLLESENML